jgi:hypothetical protein
MNGLIGTETPVDDLLQQYFPGRPQSALYQAFESEQAALMAALLMEMRGDGIAEDATRDAEAVYYSEPNVAVDTVEESSVEWDFRADSVVLYGFDAPVAVAFKSPNKQNRLIMLSPNDAPFSLSVSGGLGADTVYYRKQTASDADTTMNVLALK